MIENACPYAPGAVKPESMPSAIVKGGWTVRIRNGKLLVLLFSILALTLLYGFSYSSLNWSGSPVLFQDGYVVKMSVYTYLLSMITYYFRGYRQKKRE
jgi:hypothetical protein